MSRACNAAISVLPRRLPLGGRLWLDFRAPERPRSRSLKHASRACNAAISVLPVFTRAPARVNTFGPANLWHGAGTRGGLRPRFGGAGGGHIFATRFLTTNPPRTPRHSTMRVGGVGADSWSEGGCFFGAAFRRCVRDPRLPSSGLCLWPLGQVLHEGGGAQEGLPRSRGPAHATMTLPTHC